LAGHAKKVVDSIAKEIGDWWQKNRAEAVDWGVRINFISAGVAVLGLAGADMQIATAAVSAIVGGEKVIEAIRRK
jgi:hypothetical protein